MKYVKLSYKPNEDVIATYLIESKLGLRKAGAEIAKEESVGTWTHVSTFEEDIYTSLGAKVFEVNEIGKERGIVKIAYPSELFEPFNLPQHLAVYAGNLFGMKSLQSVKLLNVQYPNKLLKNHPGPLFGIKGIRKILGVKERALVGTIIKPKVGLSPEKTAEVAYQAALEVDLIKDDETLTNQKFCPLEQRLEKVMEALDKAKEETEEQTLYAVNVTANQSKMLERAEKAVDNGANCLMIDVIACGLSALQELRKAKLGIPIHCHRAGHASFTRNKKHGISMKVIAKLVRIAGGDSLHIGTFVGKMESDREAVIKNREALVENNLFKSCLPVCSGGLHPGKIPRLLDLVGKNVLIMAGGGIHGHPYGTEAGAKAMKQAVEAWMKNISLDKYAKSHQELKKALKKWV